MFPVGISSYIYFFWYVSPPCHCRVSINRPTIRIKGWQYLRTQSLTGKLQTTLLLLVASPPNGRTSIIPFSGTGNQHRPPCVNHRASFRPQFLLSATLRQWFALFDHVFVAVPILAFFLHGILCC